MNHFHFLTEDVESPVRVIGCLLNLCRSYGWTFLPEVGSVFSLFILNIASIKNVFRHDFQRK